MSEVNETFFTTVGCMDGRVQNPVAEFGRNKFGASFADTITEAGLAGLLANTQDQSLLDSLKHKILVSVEKHHSKGMIVHGHQDCAGNPVDDTRHKENIMKSCEVLRSFLPNDFEIVPVFVVRKGEDWVVNPLE